MKTWMSWIREVLMGPNGRVAETDRKAAPLVENSKKAWDETQAACKKATEEIRALCKRPEPSPVKPEA